MLGRDLCRVWWTVGASLTDRAGSHDTLPKIAREWCGVGAAVMDT